MTPWLQQSEIEAVQRALDTERPPPVGMTRRIFETAVALVEENDRLRRQLAAGGHCGEDKIAGK